MLEHFEKAISFWALCLIVWSLGRQHYFETGNTGIAYIIVVVACLLLLMWHSARLGEAIGKKISKK